MIFSCQHFFFFFFVNYDLTKFKMMAVTGNEEGGVRMERADTQGGLSMVEYLLS